MPAREAPDPRLVALGLVPPEVASEPESATPQATPSQSATAAPAPAAPAAPPPQRGTQAPLSPSARGGAALLRSTPAATQRPLELIGAGTQRDQVRTAAPAAVPGGGLLLFERYVWIGRVLRRRVTLRVYDEGIALGNGRWASWHDITAIDARRGRVRVATKRPFAMTPDLDGMPESSLAENLAEALLQASSGSSPRAETLRVLDEMRTHLLVRFREHDDEVLPLVFGIAALSVTVLLVVLLPLLVPAPFRAGQRVPEGAYLLYPPVPSLDPRTVTAAVLGGALAAVAVLRMAMGPGTAHWARGVLRRWHAERSRLLGAVRRVVASAALRARPIAFGFVLALALLIPAGRDRVLIDASGIHVRGSLPAFDRDYPWAVVTAVREIPVSPRERTEGRAVEFRLSDGSVVTTRGHDFYGDSEFDLLRFAQRMTSGQR